MNPYINLRSYTEANSKYFKGRDNEIEDILTILKQSDVIVLIVSRPRVRARFLEPD